ncbi:hypothetical protein FB451DRAFT_1195875 [Mycena latifolia]|nr:hypothetical protein FB451DRAFT_1195875 [Mycena latifolia]
MDLDENEHLPVEGSRARLLPPACLGSPQRPAQVLEQDGRLTAPPHVVLSRSSHLREENQEAAVEPRAGVRMLSLSVMASLREAGAAAGEAMDVDAESEAGSDTLHQEDRLNPSVGPLAAAFSLPDEAAALLANIRRASEDEPAAVSALDPNANPVEASLAGTGMQDESDPTLDGEAAYCAGGAAAVRLAARRAGPSRACISIACRYCYIAGQCAPTPAPHAEVQQSSLDGSRRRGTHSRGLNCNRHTTRSCQNANLGLLEKLSKNADYWTICSSKILELRSWRDKIHPIPTIPPCTVPNEFCIDFQNSSVALCLASFSTLFADPSA